MATVNVVRHGVYDFISQPDEAFRTSAKRVMEKER